MTDTTEIIKNAARSLANTVLALMPVNDNPVKRQEMYDEAARLLALLKSCE